MTLVFRAGIGVVAAYLLLVVLAWLFQDRLAFPAPQGEPPDPRAVGIPDGTRIDLVMGGHTTLTGWFLPPTASGGGGPAPSLLWFYGNGETIATIWPVLRDFRPPEAGLLVVDYPGYGGSGGRATEAGLYEAADSAYAWLASRPGLDPARIFVYGRSLGSAVATHTAATHSVAGLILESPFTSAAAMTRTHYRFLPRFILRLGLDNLGMIGRVTCPVLVFHGTADRLVPTAMGLEVAAAAGSGPAEVVLIQDAGHNDTYEMGGARYRSKVQEFVRSGHRVKSP